MGDPINSSALLKAVPQAGHSGSVTDVAWSPDGRVVASASEDGTVRLWNPDEGGLVGVLEGEGSLMLAIAWHPGGEEIAAAGWDGSVTVWDAFTGHLRQTLKGHVSRVLSVDWEADGDRIASGGTDRTVRIWDAEGGRLERVLEHDGTVISVAWDGGGRLATVCDGRIRIWDAASGELLRLLEGHGLDRAVWDPAGRRIASVSSPWSVGQLPAADAEVVRDAVPGEAAAGDETGGAPRMGVKIWDAETGWVLSELGGDAHGARTVAWDPDGEKIAVGTFDSVKIWEVGSERLWGLLEEDQDGISSLAWDPGGRRIAAAAGRDGVKIWDAPSGQLLHGCEPFHSSAALTAWSPDGRTVAFVLRRAVEVRDAVTGRLRGTLKRQRDPLSAVVWDATGERLATASSGGPVKVWDSASGRCLFELENALDAIDTLAFDPAGRWIAASSEEGIRVWDLASLRTLTEIPVQASSSLALSPDGETLAAVSDLLRVGLWDVASGRPLRSLEGPAETVASVAWDPAGVRLVAGGDDPALHLWEAATGRPLNILEGHTYSVRSVAWDPGGERIASAADDRTVRIWDAASGQLLHILAAAQGTSVSFLCPGRIAVDRVSTDGFVDVWDVGASASGPGFAPRRVVRLYGVRPLAGLLITDDGFVHGPPKALEWVGFADGWELLDLDAVPERHSPERVRSAWS